MTDPLAQKIGLYGFLCTSSLGFLGHAFSLITFSAKNLRLTSAGLLFICLTLSDTLYLAVSIRDFLTFTLQLPTLRSEHLCRFRTFMLSFAAVTSAWILVLIAMDRFVRTRFPYQQARICTPKVAGGSVAGVCLCSSLFACHVLQPSFSFSTPGMNLCGPARLPPTPYSLFYYNVWPFLQLIATYFIPSCLMTVALICIYSKVRTQRILAMGSTRREKLQRQMLVLMISSVVCFAGSAVPYAVYRIIYLRSGISPSLVLANAVSTLLNLNYCGNFYVHCLTSQLFRETFVKQLKRCCRLCKRRRRLATNTVLPLSRLSLSNPTPTTH